MFQAAKELWKLRKTPVVDRVCVSSQLSDPGD